MTDLRKSMIEEMQRRNLAANTQSSYFLQVSCFARHFKKSPSELGEEEICAYHLYFTKEKKPSPGSIQVAISALRFFYKVTLKRGWKFDEVLPHPKKPQKLPIVLSPEEAQHFQASIENFKHWVRF